MTTVLTAFPTLPPADRAAICRYAGGGKPDDELLAESLCELEPQLHPAVCYCEFDIQKTPTGLHLGFAETQSQSLCRRLLGCNRVVLFAATVGLAPDRCIARYSRFSPAKSLWMQAIGTERIEAACDAFCADLESRLTNGTHTVPRFSPGYGDLPLSMQEAVFAVLDCPRRIGLTLNASLLMSPSKSVTALVGITASKEEHEP